MRSATWWYPHVPVIRPEVVSAAIQSASAASTMNAFAPVPAFRVLMYVRNACIWG